MHKIMNEKVPEDLNLNHLEKEVNKMSESEKDFKMMTIQEAAEYLHMPLNSLYKKYDQMIYFKYGHRIMFDKYQLNEWIKAQMRNNVN